MAFRNEAAHRHRSPGAGAPSLEGTAANVATRRLRIFFCTARRNRFGLTPDIAGSGSVQNTCREVLRHIAHESRQTAAKVRTRVEHPFRIASGCSAMTRFAIEG